MNDDSGAGARGRRPARGAEKTAANPTGMERAFAVLEIIAANPSRVVDVTNELGLAWATVHRTIKKLEAAQVITRDPESSKYEIGPWMWYIGSAYLANNKALNASISYLARDRDIRDVDIQIVERVGNYAVVTHAEKRQATPISKAQYGFSLPLHAGSKGRVLLAYESDDFIDAYLSRKLEKLTPDTVTDPGELRRQVAIVREQGWAFTVADVQPFTGSISAPIFNSSNQAIGCVCFIFLRRTADDPQKVDQLKEKLSLMTHSISLDLGWRPGH